MLDIKFVIDNIPLIKKIIQERNMHVDISSLEQLHRKQKELIKTTNNLQEERNKIAKKISQITEKDERGYYVEKGKDIRTKITQLEEERSKITSEMQHVIYQIPNLCHPDTPIGSDESANKELRQWGKIPQLLFPIQDHISLLHKLDLADFERAAQVAAPKFYYLRNQAVILELALVRYALDTAQKFGFTLTSTPDLAKPSIIEGIGFAPRGDESNIYTIENEDLCLIGTSEITLGGYYQDTIFNPHELPIRMAGVSHCFRKEAGAAGKYAKGLYRVHQFTKVELFSYTTPEQSEKELQQLLSIEESLFQNLSLPYRVVECASGDLGSPAFRKFDIEVWMPGRNDWGEVTSVSHCTDYQARRLNIRYHAHNSTKKKNRFVHTLNGTAIATSRVIIAILENFQNEDFSIDIPEILQPYTGFKKIVPT